MTEPVADVAPQPQPQPEPLPLPQPDPLPLAQPPAGRFGLGLLAAIVAAVVGGIIWAVITVTSDYRIGVVAVGIGVLVGLAIDRFGGGDRRLPIAGAVIALLGCLLGDLIADAHIIGKQAQIGTFAMFGHPHLLWLYYKHAFRAFDAVFYAIAAYEAYQFARRGIRRAQAGAAASPAPAPAPVPAPAPAPAPEPATPGDSSIAP